MGSRTSAGWLIAIIVVLTGLGLGASLIPLRKCASCDGYDQQLRSNFPNTFGSPPYPLDCPDCADRGTVSILRGWRPRVSDEVRRILRQFLDSPTSPLMTTLEPLVLEPGTKPEAFLEANGQRAEFGLPQFVSAEGTFYLVLPAFYPPRKSPDGTGAGFLLVHCDGRALDCVQLISTNRNAELGHYFLPKPADDGSQLALVDNVPFGASYKLHQWRQPTRELSVSTALYLRVRRDRFEVLEVK